MLISPTQCSNYSDKRDQAYLLILPPTSREREIFHKGAVQISFLGLGKHILVDFEILKTFYGIKRTQTFIYQKR